MNTYPFLIPFSFDSVAAGTQTTASVYVQENLCVYGLTTFNSQDINSNYYCYTLEIVNYQGLTTLMDAPMQSGAFESDCRTLWRFPSPWRIPRNTRLVAAIESYSGSATFDAQPCLVASKVDDLPDRDRSPFIYSYLAKLGFEDLVTSGGGTTALGFNEHTNQAVTKTMLKDFELCSIVLDDHGLPSALVPCYSLQIYCPEQNLRLFSRPVLNSGAGGGITGIQGGPASTVFPNRNVQQYQLPEPVIIKQGHRVRVEFHMAPTYLTSTQIHDMNQRLNMILIGNHLH